MHLNGSPSIGFPQFGWSLDLNGPSFFSQGRRLTNKTYFTNGNRGVIYMADFTNPTAAGSTKVAVKELLHERMLKPGRTRHPGALENEGLWLLIMNEHGIRLCTCASEIPVILIKIRGISNTSRTQMFTPAHTRIHRRTPTHDLSHTPNTMYNRFFLLGAQVSGQNYCMQMQTALLWSLWPALASLSTSLKSLTLQSVW